MLEHFAGRVWPGGWIFGFGYLGVAVFFVLSGYVIAMSVADRPITAGFVGRFALRRSIRLDPPYWASLIAAIGLALVAQRIGFDKQLPPRDSVIAHLFYAQTILGYEQIMAVYWTLCLEIQFYLFFVLLLWILGQRLNAVSLTVVGVLFLLSLIELAGVDLTPRGVFLPYWFCFTLGMLTHWTVVRRLRPLYLFVAIAIAAAFAFSKHGDWCVMAAVTALAIYSSQGRTWLSGSVVQWLGRMSYSLYLFHGIVGWVAMSLALRVMPKIPAMLCGILVSLVVSWVAYLVIEQSSVRLSRLVPMTTGADRVGAKTLHGNSRL